MFNIQKVSKSFITKTGFRTLALNDVSLKLPQKGLVFILGKSGSGKSTLLNLLGGLDTYDQGNITIKGYSTRSFKQSDLDTYRNGTVGFIFQDFNLIETMSVHENIALVLELQGQTPEHQVISDFLARVGMQQFQNRKINELSGGQKQRVAIVRALIKNPEIILADEPTGNLDSQTSQQVLSILKQLSQDHLVVVVSHDQESAYQFADRVIEFKDGTIVEDISRSRNSTKTKKPQFAKGQVLTEEMIKIIQTQQKNPLKENFEPTKEVLLDAQPTPFKQIKSQLPLGKSLKMGASALKNKKILLVFSVLITALMSFLFSIALQTLVFFQDEIKEIEQEAYESRDRKIGYCQNNPFYTEAKKKEMIDEVKQETKHIIEREVAWRRKIANATLITIAIFSLIAFFIIYMYFNASIKLKQREIGTLRALGAKGSTVAKIFFCEGFVYANIINVFVIICNLLRIFLIGHFVFTMEPSAIFKAAFTSPRFYFGLVTQFFYVFFIVFLSVVFPITRLSRKKPIDVLLNK
ncbi:ATP-binding cassette domain-containing protein [Candidatus Phytoplasma solani]|uniref:ABC transporter ATP-binding protein/permease n=1 Tax=Candidatus Phytoplasma solani TaxID=69896 RepID=UPI00358E13F3